MPDHMNVTDRLSQDIRPQKNLVNEKTISDIHFERNHSHMGAFICIHRFINDLLTELMSKGR